MHKRGRNDVAGARGGLAVIAGAAVAAAWAWPAAAGAQQQVGEEAAAPPAGEQSSTEPLSDEAWLEQSSTERISDEAWLEQGSHVELRDLQVDGPAVGPGTRISMPGWTDGQRQDGAGSVGGIPIPSNARMPGEVRYIEVPVPVEEDDDYSYYDDRLFIRGLVTDLHGRDRDRDRRDRDHRRRRVSDPISGGLLPSDAVFRRAQLRFSEAATAGSSGSRRSDDAFRRAQLRFHEASTRPHVDRDSGARRESDRSRRDGDRARDRRGGERRERRAPRGRRERPRRLGEAAVAPGG